MKVTSVCFALVCAVSLVVSQTDLEFVFTSDYNYLSGVSSIENTFSPPVIWTSNTNTQTAFTLNTVGTNALYAFTGYNADNNQAGAANNFRNNVVVPISNANTIGVAFGVEHGSIMTEITAPAGDRYLSFVARIGGTPDFFIALQNVDLGATINDYNGPFTLYAYDSNQYMSEGLNEVPEVWPPAPPVPSSDVMYAPQPVAVATAAIFYDANDNAIPVGNVMVYRTTALPSVEGHTPALLSTTASTTLKVTGKKFGPSYGAVPTRTVTIGGVDCPVVVSDGIQDAGDTYIACTIPAMAEGTYDIVVTITTQNGGQTVTQVSTNGDGKAVFGTVEVPQSAASSLIPSVVAALVAVFVGFF